MVFLVTFVDARDLQHHYRRRHVANTYLLHVQDYVISIRQLLGTLIFYCDQCTRYGSLMNKMIDGAQSSHSTIRFVFAQTQRCLFGASIFGAWFQQSQTLRMLRMFCSSTAFRITDGLIGEDNCVAKSFILTYTDG